MSYSYQTFTQGEILTSTKCQQVEDNIRDHRHGRNSVVSAGITFEITAKSSGFTVSASDAGELFACTGTFTIDFDASSSLGNGWGATFANVGAGTITLDPNGAETIDGQTTITISSNTTISLWCDGSNLFSLGGAKGLILLATATAADDATVDFTSGFTATYDYYTMALHGVRPATNGQHLRARAGAGSFDTGSNYDYATTGIDSNGGAVTISGNATTFWQLTGVGVSNGATAAVSGFVNIHNVNSTAQWKQMTGLLGLGSDSAGFSHGVNNGGSWRSTSALDRLRFFFSSGNIAEGEFALYGWNR